MRRRDAEEIGCDQVLCSQWNLQEMPGCRALGRPVNQVGKSYLAAPMSLKCAPWTETGRHYRRHLQLTHKLRSRRAGSWPVLFATPC